MNRTDITFPSGDGSCGAWLYRPEGGPAGPVIVMAHGLGSVKEMRLDAYAERFTAAGYSCLVFDYRHFGASSGEPRQLLDVDRQLQDWAAAIAYARSLDFVDPDRVVLWGTSFGGGHVILTAARDPRVAAAIAQCPFTSGIASSLAAHPWSSSRVFAVALADAVTSALGRREPIRIPAAGPPRSVALMSSADSLGGYLALVPPGFAFGNRVAARVALRIARHSPGRAARDVRCPIFFALCAKDSVAPSRTAARHALRAPDAEVRMYPAGHFDIYVGDDFERTVADQTAFLTRHVPVAA
ncbi:alpha/beta hydrolase [Streptomyces rubiginosohelvolus]|uniref:Alpha/beta hydrolase n=1 Tax=Streptomyces rubiginosohelvolus TaxID=67362 RepID=A0ABW6F0P9_9ACTN